MSKRFVAAVFFALLCSLAVALIISAGRTSAGAHALAPGSEPQFGIDIQANPTVSSTPATFRNHSLAINPANPNQVISAFESAFSAAGVIASGWSNDGGSTWNTTHFHGPWSGDVEPLLDPHVAFDANGVAYY